jgi:hypothetical protein
MQEFIKHFVRTPAGEWVCVAPVELQTPSGRVQVASGTRFTRDSVFMGLDIARMLDEQEEKDRAKR